MKIPSLEETLARASQMGDKIVSITRRKQPTQAQKKMLLLTFLTEMERVIKEPCQKRTTMKRKLEPGDVVRVVGSKGTAKIRSIRMHGVLLEKNIGGHRLWNLDDLRLVKRKKR